MFCGKFRSIHSPFERLCGKTRDYSGLSLFGCVCYVLLTFCEHTKLTTQSVECVFLCYSARHNGYCYWDPVVHRMRTSQNVVFDESCPFYSRPSSNASLTSVIDPLSFLLFPDAPLTLLPISRSTLTSSLNMPSVSSYESSPVVPDYTVMFLVTQFYRCREA
jgi:hypothetical protein